MATALTHPEHRHPPIHGGPSGAVGEDATASTGAGGGGGGGAAGNDAAAATIGLNPDGSLKVNAAEDVELRVSKDGIEYVPTTDERKGMAAAKRFMRNPFQPLKDGIYRKLPLTEVAKGKAAVARFVRDPTQGLHDEIHRHLPLTQVAKGRAAVSRFVRDPTQGLRDEVFRNLPLTEVAKVLQLK